MTEQYWADAGTKNCVWLFQVLAFGVPSNKNDGELANYWLTEKVFLLKNEALVYGRSRPCARGNINEGWRIWGVPCDGLMVELLGHHNEEFETEVEYITKRVQK
jgi:hypothetical protein